MDITTSCFGGDASRIANSSCLFAEQGRFAWRLRESGDAPDAPLHLWRAVLQHFDRRVGADLIAALALIGTV
ncbi:MAG: hypothetical protein NDI84_17145, partial [Steroidobacteraceae bacterium]|nr:hypothetical protein [Steroidobacteraceae bacterium]